jgi:hypothetical protein
VQRAAIKQWFWRTAVTGYFGGWNTGNMSADQQAAARFAAGQTTSIETSINDQGPAVWISQQFRLNTAHAKILAVLLAFSEPVDLLTGQRIDVSKALHYANSKEYHHFFPRGFLTSSGTSMRRANLLANLIMLTSDSNKKISNRAPSDYLKDVEAALGDHLEAALDSNLISMEAFTAAKADDYDAFLRARAETIYQRTKALTLW